MKVLLYFITGITIDNKNCCQLMGTEMRFLRIIKKKRQNKTQKHYRESKDKYLGKQTIK
jgi:hypothetical protein